MRLEMSLDNKWLFEELKNENVNHSFGVPSSEEMMKRLEGKKVYARNVYLLEEALGSEMIKIYGLFLKQLSKKEIRDMYHQYLIETKKIIEKYPILVSEDEKKEVREIATGIALPKIEFNARIRAFYLYLVGSPNIYANGVKHEVGNTKLFLFGDKTRVSSEEIEDYVRRFSEPENYDALLKMLIDNMKSCSVINEYSERVYQPEVYASEEMLSYYQQLHDKRNYLTLEKKKLR